MSEARFERLHTFDDVDESSEASALIAFLEHIETQRDVVLRRQRSYELLHLQPGTRVADVGAGIGTVLAELLALGVRATGVDLSEQMALHARKRVPGAEYHVADAASLPFEDGELAGYRAERVYQHLHDPAAALVEARRVLSSGGRIVLVDQDWDAFVLDHHDRALTRAILRGFADSIPEPWIGRRYHSLLLDAGFEDVSVAAETVVLDYDYAAPVLPAIGTAAVERGVASRRDVDGWLDDQRARGEEGRFFGAMTHFLAAARCP